MVKSKLLPKFGWIKFRYNLRENLHSITSQPWAGGLLLILSVIVAMLLANMPWSAQLYEHLLQTNLSLHISTADNFIDITFPRDMTVEKLVNDALMVIFFFTVGLEIKREILFGHLSTLKCAVMPIIGAVGGMLVPALIYIAVNHGTNAANGWGIPTATDIAFALGILSLLGDRVPVSLKIFLTALAIADDLGAIIVIAIFYGGSINWVCLAVAMALLVVLYFIRRLGETGIAYFLIPAFVIWGLFYYSGIHATLSGVAMAMIVPMRARYNKSYFLHKINALHSKMMREANIEKRFPSVEYRQYLYRLRNISTDSMGMSYRLEDLLNPYVTFLIMPIFALVNTGIVIKWDYFNIFYFSEAVGHVGLGVFLGLVVGKPIGIFLAGRAAAALGIAEKPAGSTWAMLFAVACFGGIGFTMSIFVDSLAFDSAEMINRGKIAILVGSTTAAIIGTIMVKAVSSVKKVKQQKKSK